MSDEFQSDVMKALGRIEAKVDNTSAHVSAVSRKADDIREELGEHMRDDGAHGLGAQEKAASNIRGWLGWVVAAVGLLGTLVGKWSGSSH